VQRQRGNNSGAFCRFRPPGALVIHFYRPVASPPDSRCTAPGLDLRTGIARGIGHPPGDLAESGRGIVRGQHLPLDQRGPALHEALEKQQFQRVEETHAGMRGNGSRRKLGARDLPKLLGIGLEKSAVQVRAEAVDRPILHRLVFAGRRQGSARSQTAFQEAASGLDPVEIPHLKQDASGRQRIIEILPFVVELDLARSGRQPARKQAEHGLDDFGVPGKKRMRPHVHGASVAANGPRQPSDDGIGFQHRCRNSSCRQPPRQAQSGNSTAQDDGTFKH